jgi:hypothetical protein
VLLERLMPVRLPLPPSQPTKSSTVRSSSVVAAGEVQPLRAWGGGELAEVGLGYLPPEAGGTVVALTSDDWSRMPLSTKLVPWSSCRRRLGMTSSGHDAAVRLPVARGHLHLDDARLVALEVVVRQRGRR